jgi:hypothetical protein
MRRKSEAVLAFESSDDGLPKVVRDYRARYRAISQVLDRNPEILEAVHQDLRKLSQGGRGGRKGDFTSESILRALLVQHTEGLAFRDAVKVHQRLRRFRATACRLRLDRVGDPAPSAALRREARSPGGRQGFLPGKGQVRCLGRVGGHVGDSATDARLRRQDAGTLASLPVRY